MVKHGKKNLIYGPQMFDDNACKPSIVALTNAKNKHSEIATLQ